MNQEAKELKAFLDHIAADPRDLVTRQVFADWLDEHDEPELSDEQRNFSLVRYDAEQRLIKVADRYADGDYEGMVQGVKDGDYCFSDDFWQDAVNDDAFWRAVEIVTDEKINQRQRETSRFRCAC